MRWGLKPMSDWDLEIDTRLGTQLLITPGKLQTNKNH